MAISQIARRYARALYEQAVADGRIEQVQGDLAAIRESLSESAEFAAFAGNYVIPAERRTAVIRALFEGRADPLTLRFLLFLDAKKRMGALPAVAESFGAMFDAHSGILDAQIVSATPLAPNQFADIGRHLEKKFNRRIKASASVDPELLGGFRIRVGNTIHDFSVASQLQTLHRKFAHA